MGGSPARTRVYRARAIAMVVAMLGAGAAGVPPAVAAPLAESPAATVNAAAPLPGDWAQSGGGPTHSGYNAAETRISAANVGSLSLAWQFNAHDRLSAPPAIANGVVYLTVLGTPGMLYAIPEACGFGGAWCDPIWSATLGGASATTPAVADGVVYVAADDYKLYAFAVGCNTGGGTCTPLWTATTGYYVESSPTVSGGVVYVGSHDGKVYAFKVGCATGGGTCSPLWVGQTANWVQGSPAVADGKVFVTSNDNKIYAFAVGCGTGGATCSPLWTGASGGRFVSSPAVSNGVVYAGSQDGVMYAFSTSCGTGGATCSPIWTATTGAAINGSAAVANGVVYVGSRDNKLYAFGVGCASGGATCTPIWTATVGDKISDDVIVANGVVYASSFDKKLYAFGVGCASGGGSCSPLWVAPIENMIWGNAPALANGYLYVGSNTGYMSVFSVGPADWTQFHRDPDRRGKSPNEAVLSPFNAGALRQVWTGSLGGVADSSPVVANGVVYAARQDKRLYAYPAGCVAGDPDCAAIWSAGTVGNVMSSPAVSAGEVYVSSFDGYLYAFGVGCMSGGGSCAWLWRGQTGGVIATSSPAVVGGVVYVGSEDGKLYAFPVGCATGGATCSPLWTATVGGGIASSPAVSGGMVYVGSEDSKLYAFAVGCNSGGGSCSPVWSGTTGGWIRGTPAVADGVVYAGSDDHKLYAFAVGCNSGGGACTPLWTGTTGAPIGSSPAVGTGAVYVGSSDNYMYAFAVGCNTGGGSCSPLWKGGAGGAGQRMDSSPAVANAVVYIGSTDGHLYAFSEGCATGGANCPPLLMQTLGGAVGLSSPAVVEGSVYIAAQDGNLYRFALPYNPSTYLPITPARVLDTRPNGTGVWNMGLQGKFTTGLVRTFGVAGVKYVGGGNALAIPASAVAVTGNLTVTRQNAAGVLSLGPTVASLSLVTTLNFQATGNRANNVTLGLGAGGTLSAVLYSSNPSASADVIFDITGYFLADDTGSTYHTLSPGRVLDTRPTQGGVTHIGLTGKFTNKTVRTVSVAGVKALGWNSALVPSNASGITANVTVTNATSPGFVAFGPTMTSAPKTSTLNTDRGKNTANGVTVALRSGRLQAVWVGTAGSSADVILDVTGYFTADNTGLHYYALAPVRLIDSAAGIALPGVFTSPTPRVAGIWGAGGICPGAAAISGNLTITHASSNGYAFIAPSIPGTPTSSTVNTNTGVDAANGMDVAFDVGGGLALVWVGATGSTADLALDVTGWWGLL